MKNLDNHVNVLPGNLLSLAAWFQLPSGVPKFTPPAPMKPILIGLSELVA